MNVNPGGKQARMRDGWFMEDGIKVLQAMVFSKDNSEQAQRHQVCLLQTWPLSITAAWEMPISM